MVNPWEWRRISCRFWLHDCVGFIPNLDSTFHSLEPIEEFCGNPKISEVSINTCRAIFSLDAMLVFTFSRQQMHSCIYCNVAYIGRTVLACRHPLPRFCAVCFESDLNRLVRVFACTHVCIGGGGWGGCSQSIVAADISQETSKLSRQATVSLDEDLISHTCIVPHPTAQFYSLPLSLPLKFALI